MYAMWSAYSKIVRESVFPKRRELTSSDTKLDLTDDKDRTVLAGLKFKLSVISEPAIDFMRRVDDDIERLRENHLLTSALGKNVDTTAAVVRTNNGAAKVLGSCIVPLGKTLQLVVKVMDGVSAVLVLVPCHATLCSFCRYHQQAHPILKVSWTVLSAVYKVSDSLPFFLDVRRDKRTSWCQTLEVQMFQDEAVLDLTESLREMLGIAATFPQLLIVKGTTDVIEEIGQVSLRVASLIDEYTRHSFLGQPSLSTNPCCNFYRILAVTQCAQRDFRSRTT